jgi:hypothetical protein
MYAEAMKNATRALQQLAVLASRARSDDYQLGRVHFERGEREPAELVSAVHFRAPTEAWFYLSEALSTTHAAQRTRSI